MTPFAEAVAVIVSRKCDKAGLTQAKVGEFLGTTHTQAARLLKGERAMTVAELRLICDGIGVKGSEVFREAEAIVRRQPTPDHFTLAASEREPDPYEGLGEESQDV